MLRPHVATSTAALLFGLFFPNMNSFAQDRISGAIDNHRTVTLAGNRRLRRAPSSTPVPPRPISVWTA